MAEQRMCERCGVPVFRQVWEYRYLRIPGDPLKDGEDLQAAGRSLHNEPCGCLVRGELVEDDRG